MIILKLFGSIILLFMFLGLIFVLFSLLIAQSFISDLGRFFNSENNKDEDNSRSKKQTKSSKEIPTIAQCPKCGTYYAEIPESGKCSCGEKLR